MMTVSRGQKAALTSTLIQHQSSAALFKRNLCDHRLRLGGSHSIFSSTCKWSRSFKTHYEGERSRWPEGAPGEAPCDRLFSPVTFFQPVAAGKSHINVDWSCGAHFHVDSALAFKHAGFLFGHLLNVGRFMKQYEDICHIDS